MTNTEIATEVVSNAIKSKRQTPVPELLNKWGEVMPRSQVVSRLHDAAGALNVKIYTLTLRDGSTVFGVKS